MAEATKVIDVKKATPEEIAAGLALLGKKREREEKIKKGEIKTGKKWSELSPEEKAKYRAKSARYTAANKLFITKAVAAGVKKATEAEIDAYLAAKKK